MWERLSQLKVIVASACGLLTFETLKWGNRTVNQQYLPAQRTPMANLLLAGAHARADGDAAY